MLPATPRCAPANRGAAGVFPLTGYEKDLYFRNCPEVKVWLPSLRLAGKAGDGVRQHVALANRLSL